MIIRKLFKFENAHIVRNCTSQRCSQSIHGHSYKIEVLLESNFLDNGQMVYDFGLLKGSVRDLIDSFDHATAFWDKDDVDYINSIKAHSDRWIQLPVSPSAEQFSRIFFVLLNGLLGSTVMKNAEADVHIHSVIVHETDTGYAQCFSEDAYNIAMGIIDYNDIIFSPQVMSEWEQPGMFEALKRGDLFVNPAPTHQVF